jgi:hypothetical protein
MSESTPGGSMEFTLGSEVSCSDGVCGQLRRVIVDPTDRKATHLVVGPKHWTGIGRLVPMDQVAAGGRNPDSGAPCPNSRRSRKRTRCSF